MELERVGAVMRRLSINHEAEPLAGKVVSIIVAMISACLLASLFGQCFHDKLDVECKLLTS